jgi:hypothetical protein
MLYIIDIYSIVSLIIYLLFIYKLKNINCECSEDWKRKFILIVTYIFIVVNVIFASLFLSKTNVRTTIISYYVLLALNIGYTIIILLYIYDLKKNKCECSNIWEREYMYINSIISVIFLCISMLTIIVVASIHRKLNLTTRNIIPNFRIKRRKILKRNKRR